MHKFYSLTNFIHLKLHKYCWLITKLYNACDPHLCSTGDRK